MGILDGAVLALIAALAGGAVLYLRKQKKEGKGCAGCPGCGGCSGNCYSRGASSCPAVPDKKHREL